MTDLDDLLWAEGCDPQDRNDRKYRRKVKMANSNGRKRKKSRGLVDKYNENIPAGSLRKFYV